MELRKFNAAVRAESGKGASARLRKGGHIPAVAYGKGQPAQSLSISPSDLSSVLKSEHGRNSVIELDVTGQSKLTVLIRDYQYHPLSRELLHADFVQIALDQPVDVDVPLDATGKASPATFSLGAVDKILGAPLIVKFDEQAPKVRVSYATNPEASGLQWLSEAQTAGKQHPFLFSQSQAIHARSWVPLQDTPAVRFTYRARS